MHVDPADVWSRLAVLAAVLYAGWLARRRRWLGESATRVLSRLCTDVFFPCLTFTQMLRIIGRRPITEQSLLLLVGAALIGVAILAAFPLTRGISAASRRTAWLAVSVPNWIFLPLPIAALVYGPDGVATVLLVNVAAQFFLWSVCVAILRGFRSTLREGWIRALNPGLIATVAGAAIALANPESIGWFERPGWIGYGLGLAATAGTLTIPLSMLVTGSQLGALSPGLRLDAALQRVLWARLIVVPAISVVLLWVLAFVLPLSSAMWRTAVLIAAMPVALSGGVLVERYGGDRELMSRAILMTTSAALATVPLFLLAAHILFR